MPLRNLDSTVRFGVGLLIVVYFFITSQIQTILVHEESRATTLLLFDGNYNNNGPLDRPPFENDDKRFLLQEKLDNVYIKTGSPYQGNLWDLSDFVPDWMKEYFEWHKEERGRLLMTNPQPADWKNLTRIMVMQCLKGFDYKCGGTADRTKPFLLALREAYHSKRFLVIHWTLPALLEEFLVPPEGGFDWRAPESLHTMLTSNPLKGMQIYKAPVLIAKRNKTDPVIRTRMQSATGFQAYYDQDRDNPNEPTLEQVFHDVWRIFFTPSPPIQQILKREMTAMNLVPGRYSAAHLRALYGKVQNRTDDQLLEFTSESLNCASKLLPGKPIYFASDLSRAIDVANKYGKTKSVDIVSRTHQSSPLHLDKADGLHNRKPSDFYDTFVDLYLMGMSRCVSHSKGGFGQWASLISYNASCRHNIKMIPKGIASPCNWTEGSAVVEEEMSTKRPPLFLAVKK